MRFLTATRYLILLPILGLALAAALFFIFGAIGLVRTLIESLVTVLSPAGTSAIHPDDVIIGVVSYVHVFLVGTVLYITAIGFFQLFIKEIEIHGWLKIENTEDLETNLIGVTVVVLAVHFMGDAFSGGSGDLFAKGAGIALPIAALGVFIGLRAWARHQNRLADAPDDDDHDGPPDFHEIDHPVH